jgi:hypothetical protein
MLARVLGSDAQQARVPHTPLRLCLAKVALARVCVMMQRPEVHARVLARKLLQPLLPGVERPEAGARGGAAGEAAGALVGAVLHVEAGGPPSCEPGG